MILGRLILSPGLPRMAPVAQGLPVAPVPEQFHVATMRNDMIHIRCLHVPAFLHALCAQRVLLYYVVLLFRIHPTSRIILTRNSAV